MSEMNDFISNVCIDLEKAGVQGVPEYKQRLMDNSESTNFEDFLLECRAALMFRKAGFGVTLREAPDLALESNNEQLYAEVKHFRLKEQDLIDDAKMSEPGKTLALYGDTVPMEGEPAWEQVYNVAKNKVSQYKKNVPNILVVESNSPNCIDDVVIPTVVNMVGEAVCSGECPGFSRLNGILLVSLGCYNISQKRNVFFFLTGKPDVPLTPEVLNLLSRIYSG